MTEVFADVVCKSTGRLLHSYPFLHAVIQGARVAIDVSSEERDLRDQALNNAVADRLIKNKSEALVYLRYGSPEARPLHSGE
jgi:hypothetical protein